MHFFFPFQMAFTRSDLSLIFSSFLGCSLLCFLHPLPLVVCGCSGLLELFVCRICLLLFCDGSRPDALLWLWHWNDLLESVLRNILQLWSRRITLSHTLCARLLWEQQQFGHVELQSLHVGLKTLSASVATTMVHGNANGLGKLPWNLGLLQLIQGETFAQSNLHVVALRWRMHQRTKQSSRRTWKDLGRLLLASVCAALLAACLVQPGAHEDPVLPTGLASVDLPEVHIWNDIVAWLRALLPTKWLNHHAVTFFSTGNSQE